MHSTQLYFSSSRKIILKNLQYFFVLNIILFSIAGCGNDVSPHNNRIHDSTGYFKLTIISGEKVRDSTGSVMTIAEAADKAKIEINSGKKLQITIGTDARISDEVTTKKYFKASGIRYIESGK